MNYEFLQSLTFYSLEPIQVLPGSGQACDTCGSLIFASLRGRYACYLILQLSCQAPEKILPEVTPPGSGRAETQNQAEQVYSESMPLS